MAINPDVVGRYIMKYLSPIEFALITLASRYYSGCTARINVALHVGGVFHTTLVTPAVTLQQTHCTPGDKHTHTWPCATNGQAYIAKQVGNPQLTNPRLNYTHAALCRE